MATVKGFSYNGSKGRMQSQKLIVMTPGQSSTITKELRTMANGMSGMRTKRNEERKGGRNKKKSSESGLPDNN